MKSFLMGLLLLFSLLLFTSPCFAVISGENYVWLSEDLSVKYTKIGYLHKEQKFVKAISENLKSGVGSSFDLSFGSDILSFGQNSGLYGEIGINNGLKFNLFFGAGINYSALNSNFLLMCGTKYNIQEMKLVYDALVFFHVLPPFVLNLSYDNLNGHTVFVGAGLKFE
jgi:hypothetical protein